MKEAFVLVPLPKTQDQELVVKIRPVQYCILLCGESHRLGGMASNPRKNSFRFVGEHDGSCV